MKAYGSLIQRTRERLGYSSQGAIGQALRKTQTQMSRIESGASQNMLPPEDVHRIRDVLGIPVVHQLQVAGYELEGYDDALAPELQEIVDLARIVDWEVDPTRLSVIEAMLGIWSRDERNSLQLVAEEPPDYDDGDE